MQLLASLLLGVQSCSPVVTWLIPVETSSHPETSMIQMIKSNFIGGKFPIGTCKVFRNPVLDDLVTQTVAKTLKVVSQKLGGSVSYIHILHAGLFHC